MTESKHLPCFGAVDIGSNTVQMRICTVENGRLVSCATDLRTTRLGACSTPNMLTDEAMEKTCAVLADYARQMQEHGVCAYRMVATSAVRDARNKDVFRQMVRQAVPGAELEILQGQEEAALSFRGAHACGDYSAAWPVVDVGGSSSELILADAEGVHAFSANVGAVRAMHAGWDYEEILQRLRAVYPQHTAASVLGVGGTVTTMAALYNGLTAYDSSIVEGTQLHKDYLHSLLQQLQSLTVEQRCALSPLLAQRGEIMVHGLFIWLAVMEVLQAETITVTDGGILEGAVLELADRFAAGR